MKVLIADKMAPVVAPSLKALGCEVIQDESLSGEALKEAIAEVNPAVLIVRSTKVGEEHLASGRALALVIRAGAGVNTIALDAASQRGVYVSNCPGKNAAAVAELALGHILNADRRIADNVKALRDGEWKKKTFAKGTMGLKDRTLGLIGMGSIGTEVARRAKAFDMTVVAWDISLTASRAAALGVVQASSASEVAAAADVLSVHIALNEHTRGLVSREIFSAMKPGAIFVNTSRGEVVDEEALSEAIDALGIKAGLDVFCGEPTSDGPWRSPLAEKSGVYGTHHIGASTEQAAEAVGDEVVRIVKTYQNSGEVPNCVNLSRSLHASHLLVVRHKDEVGVLAHVLNSLQRANINVQEMQNIVFDGAHAACAHIQVTPGPVASVVAEIETYPSIFAVDVVALENE